jgi:formate/nitrite transporter FocA (FNT family)
MEFMLLWMDNLDDVLCALRHLAPKIFGFLFAVAMFVATGFALIVSTHFTLALIAVTSSIALLETTRRRRLQSVETGGTR